MHALRKPSLHIALEGEHFSDGRHICSLKKRGRGGFGAVSPNLSLANKNTSPNPFLGGFGGFPPKKKLLLAAL